MAEPERVSADRLEGSLVDKVFVDGAVGLDRRLREGVGGLADDVDRRLHGRDQLVRAAGDERIASQIQIAGVIGTGLETAGHNAARVRIALIGVVGIITASIHGSAIGGTGRHTGRITGALVGRAAAGRGVGRRTTRNDAVGGRVARVGRAGIVRPAIEGHPVEGVLQIGGHSGAETDNEHFVPRVGQLLNHGDIHAPVFIAVGVTFRAVTAAGKRIRPVRDQDHEFRTAVLRNV